MPVGQRDEGEGRRPVADHGRGSVSTLLACRASTRLAPKKSFDRPLRKPVVTPSRPRAIGDVEDRAADEGLEDGGAVGALARQEIDQRFAAADDHVAVASPLPSPIRLANVRSHCLFEQHVAVAGEIGEKRQAGAADRARAAADRAFGDLDRATAPAGRSRRSFRASRCDDAGPDRGREGAVDRPPPGSR